MSYTDEKLVRIYTKTDGRCHLCRATLVTDRYGLEGPGAWEVDHSVPRARGGTDHLNNLFPACVPCNREKSDRSSRATRANNGWNRAPYSGADKEHAKTKQKAAGAAGGAALGGLLAGPPGALLGGVLGMVVGDSIDPEDGHRRTPAKRRRRR